LLEKEGYFDANEQKSTSLMKILESLKGLHHQSRQVTKGFYFHPSLFFDRCEVSPAWLRYELPKLGIAGSNPALRTFFLFNFPSCWQRWLAMGLSNSFTLAYDYCG
jgi:hypothetical protein